MNQGTTSTPKTKTIFELMNGLTTEKTPWEDHSLADQKNFQTWMVTRYLSMNTDMLDTVSAVQQYTDLLSPDIYYKFYLDFLPKRKIYMKYIGSKSEGSSKKTSLINFMVEHTAYSKKEMDMMLETIDIKEFIKSHGYDDEKIKKEFGI